MEDYKLKYLKYNKKYINLKSKVGGGDMTYEERLAAALALSQAGDNVVPPAATRRQMRVAAAEQGWTEDEQLKAALALSEAEDARRLKRDRDAATAPAAAAPAAVQGWTEDEQLKAALALSAAAAEDARRQRSDRGAAAALNAYDLPLEPYKPNAVTLARVNQYSTEGSKSACTVICTEFATWVLGNMRVPNVDKISEIINRGIKIYRAKFTGHTSFPEASGEYRDRFTFQHLQKGSKKDLNDIITETSKKAIESRNFICIGITKGGESIMICCTPDGKIMLFDSHPKPDLGLTSAYMIEFNNIMDALKYLTEHKIFFIEDLGIFYNAFDAYIIEKK